MITMTKIGDVQVNPLNVVFSWFMGTTNWFIAPIRRPIRYMIPRYRKGDREFIVERFKASTDSVSTALHRIAVTSEDQNVVLDVASGALNPSIAEVLVLHESQHVRMALAYNNSLPSEHLRFMVVQEPNQCVQLLAQQKMADRFN